MELVRPAKLPPWLFFSISPSRCFTETEGTIGVQSKILLEVVHSRASSNMVAYQ